MPVPTTPPHVPNHTFDHLHENNMESSSAQGGENSVSSKGKRVLKKQRVAQQVEDQIVGMLCSLCENANDRLTEMAKGASFQNAAKEQRQAVYEALNDVHGLSTGDKVAVARYLCKNNDELELFFTLDSEAKISMSAGFCGFFIWLDPEICDRAKNIIPGLLEKMNKYRHEIDQYKLRESEAEVRLEVAMRELQKIQNDLTASKIFVKKLWRAIILFLTIPGVMVHDDGGIVSVNQAYWEYVGEETDREVYFRWNGFHWYYACAEVFDERAAAEIDMEGGPDKSIHDPIHLDDIESLASTDDEDMDDILVQEGGEPAEQAPAPVDFFEVRPMFLGQEMKMEMNSDVESCLDSEE
ncbi:GRF zinc finger containing protein [Striga asiatica]|uniref:GRF zinc finger containing protein n=1 Tax=Striga asiatica TaxID=4170 RepID=A0A5A7PJZ7_STRAF|nr:GRF zinc finger containing protein [Striga asiatica]